MSSNNKKTSTEEQVFEEIKSFSTGQLRILFSELFASYLEACKEEASEINKAEERDKVLGNIIQIRTAYPSIVVKICNEYSKTLAGQVPLVENKSESIGLSLIDDAELEESILLGNINDKVNEKNDLSIRAIKRGIVRLGKKLSYEPEPASLEPKGVSEILKRSITPLKLDGEQKKHFYNAYRGKAIEGLVPLYAGVLTLLQEAGVLSEKENPVSPNFETIYEFRRQQSSQAPVQKQPMVKSTSADVDDTLNDLFKGSQSAEGLAPVLQDPIAAGAVTKASFENNALMRLIYDYVSGVNKKTEIHDPSLQAIDTDKLLSLLSELQSKAEVSEDVGNDLAQASEIVKNKISESLQSVQARVGGTEANVIDLINNLFVAILDDADLADLVKVHIGRLQIPYIKVSLLDIAFLKEEAHPARLLLNELATLGIWVEKDEGPVLQKIKDVCRSVVDNFESDLSIFVQLLNDVRSFRQQQTTKSIEVEQQTLGQAEAQAKLLHMKKGVVQSLREFLQGKKLPKELYALALKGFAPLLLKIEHAKGKKSETWKNAADLFRRIVESSQPEKSVHDLQVIVERAPTVVDEVAKLLKPVDRGQVAALLENLSSFYRQKESEYNRLIQENKDETIVMVDDGSSTDPFDYLHGSSETENAEPLAQPPIQLPVNLKQGVWCEVYMGRNLPSRRLKVASILPDTQQLIFVGPSGEEAKVKDMSEFMIELDCEQSKIISENNLFDKALAAVISNMHLARQSA